jgi:thiol-disulfide isomerase/thioredoxin
MARTPSTMIPLGTEAPGFVLPDTVSGKTMTWDDVKGERGTLVAFICNHCPFVKHVNPELVRIAHDYLSKGIQVVAISSNDALQYPDDGPDPMKANAIAQAYPFPYLYDETQEVAKEFDAACTPDFFLFNGQEKLAYRGQLDPSRPGNGIPLTGQDIRKAMDALVDGREVDQLQFPSIGCNIKWKK